jgi:predicted KAP-like P-loop ATPase
VEFVISARGDYGREEDGPRREDERLVAEAALEPLTHRALLAINAASENGSLLRHKDLMNILYRWRDFSPDPKAVRDWTNEQITSDEAAVILARRMTGHSWSYSMGGFGALGDRVSTQTTRARIEGAEEIIDVDAFKAALQRIDRDAKLDADSLDDVRKFLQAWDRRQQSPDN